MRPEEDEHMFHVCRDGPMSYFYKTSVSCHIFAREGVGQVWFTLRKQDRKVNHLEENNSAPNFRFLGGGAQW